MSEERDAKHYADVDEDVRMMNELSLAASRGPGEEYNAAFAALVNRLADYRARIDELEEGR